MLNIEEVGTQVKVERDISLLMRKNYLHAVGFILAFIVPMVVSIASSIYLEKLFPAINVYVNYTICGSLLAFSFFYFIDKFEKAVKRNQYAIYLVQFGVEREEAIKIAKSEQKQKSVGKTLSDLCEAHYKEKESEINVYRDNLMKIINEKYGEKRKGKLLLAWLNEIRSHQISLMHKQEPDASKMADKLKRYR